MSALAQAYRSEMAPRLMERLDLGNPMQVPKLSKITLNMGVGDGVSDRGAVRKAAEDLTLIAGQRAVITYARRSVAAFKVREGYPLGCKVTLRRARMYDFVERLVNVAIPRTRDFRGLDPRSFDGRGNYNIGVAEQIIFPEINYDNIDVIRGLDIAITTTAGNDRHGRALLDEFRFPFKR